MTATMPDTALTGQMLIAGEPVRGSGQRIRAFDPAAGQELEPAYFYGDATDVDAACPAAAAAPTAPPPAPPLRPPSPSTGRRPPSSAPSCSRRSPPISRPPRTPLSSE